jgi:hypothetical protein
VWENIFGWWNPWPAVDRALLRRSVWLLREPDTEVHEKMAAIETKFYLPATTKMLSILIKLQKGEVGCLKRALNLTSTKACPDFGAGLGCHSRGPDFRLPARADGDLL